jgi:hypothetical protein
MLEEIKIMRHPINLTVVLIDMIVSCQSVLWVCGSEIADLANTLAIVAPAKLNIFSQYNL